MKARGLRVRFVRIYCDQIACFVSVALADDYIYPSAMPRILLLCASPFVFSFSTSTPPFCVYVGEIKRAVKEPSELTVGKQRVRARAQVFCLLPNFVLQPFAQVSHLQPFTQACVHEGTAHAPTLHCVQPTVAPLTDALTMHAAPLGAAEAMPIVIDDDGPDALPTRPLNEKEGGASGGRRRRDDDNPAAKRPKLDAAKECDIISLSDDEEGGTTSQLEKEDEMDRGVSTWFCHMCTLKNRGVIDALCAVCDAPRGRSRGLEPLIMPLSGSYSR